ncbi:hypothetical protein ACIPL1_30605 [Pseudomonas sp. NPDC090202]|uniref:hypothetical protein n=1 Tax=Pseudomonas sp. NPDC090202 TaxID=3364476 RepID=UPI0037F53E44
MSDEELKRRQGRGRRFWDHHGSWLLLALVGICCFMAGSAFNATSTAQTVKVLVDSHERQDAQRVARIRELNQANIDLIRGVTPKVESAAEKAEQAAQKATEAVEKAGGAN